MKEVFVDTSGWASLQVPSEPFYPRARRLARLWGRAGIGAVTTNYVLNEMVALLTSPLRVPRPTIVQILRAIRGGKWLRLVHIDQSLDAAAWTRQESRQDKDWSLADCASFLVIEQRKITEAMTTDHHFEQAGFVRLPK